MKLTLYVNNSDERAVKKKLTKVETITGIKWKEDTDILHPIFTFRKLSDGAWKTFNYCKLEWDGMTTRYYFIDNFILAKGGIIELHCSVDVLMTYRSHITGMFTIVKRQENVCNPIIYDDRAIIPQNREFHAITTFTGGSGGTVGDGGDGTIILTVSG